MRPMLFSLAELGRSAEAVERGQALLALVRDAPDLPSAARYDYLYNIANVMLIAEQIDVAEELLLEAAEMDFEGIENPSTKIALHSDLAGVLTRRGDLEAALDHRYRAQVFADQIYPPEHFVRARVLSNLGSNLIALGRHQEAETALRQSLEIYQEVYGDEKHPRVVAAQNNLGRALQQADNFTAAEPYMVQVLKLAEELFGKNDPRYAIAARNLGVLCRQLGDFERSEELLLENLEIRRAIYGPEHHGVGNALLALAALRLDQVRPSEALELSDETLAMFARIDFQNLSSIVGAMTTRANALAALGRNEEARDEFDNALTVSARSEADAGRSWPDLLAAQAEFLVSQNDPEARASLTRALEVHRKVLGAKHPATLHLETLLHD